MTEVASSVLGAVAGEVAKAILEKIKRGEKISAEELAVLLIDADVRRQEEFRREVYEMVKGLQARIDRLDEKVENLRKELERKIENVRREMLELHKHLDQKIENVRKDVLALHRRIDDMYKLLVRIAEQSS